MSGMMDPNTVTPSPPSSIYSSPSVESLGSTTSFSSSRLSKDIPPTSKLVPKLPFGPQLNIFEYTQKQLESIAFDILEDRAPTLLEGKFIECKEQVELNWACRHLPQYCREIDHQSLNDWIPDVRHHATHRNIMTATAACKTMDEAANFASSLGYDEIGNTLRVLATEMDAVRCGIRKYGAISVKELPTDTKKALTERLVDALENARTSTGLPQQGQQILSDEVTGYTVEDKIKENPWSNPSYYGQDKNRNYVDPQSVRKSSSSSASSGTSKGWRANKDDTYTTRKSQTYLPPAKRGDSWRK